jgi:hypothetical protein
VTRCFIGSALIREPRGQRVRKRWATPREAAVEGLLLRDTEPEIAADGAAF